MADNKTDSRPTFFQWLAGYREQPLKQFRNYQAMGGALSYNRWLKDKKPSPPTPITPYTRSILEGEGLEDKLRRTTTAPTTAADIQSINARKAREALNRTIGGDQNALDLRRMEEERQKRLSMGFPGGGQEGTFITLPDGTMGFWTRDSEGNPMFNPVSRGTGQPTRYEPYGKNPYDNPITSQEEGQWNPYTGQWEQGAGYVDPFQQAQLDLQRQQMESEQQWRQQQMQWQREQEQARLAAEKEARLANLKANPASWLEYAALANQPAAIQPWMLPLMPQQYQGMGAGEALPGWTGSADAQNLAQLTTPSAQYMARMTPSSQQQYYGYEKARTGANPSDTDWRLWNRAPPGGGAYRGLSFNR